MLKVDKGGFGCNEGPGRLAQIEFDSLDLVFESHVTRNIVKCNMRKFQGNRPLVYYYSYLLVDRCYALNTEDHRFIYCLPLWVGTLKRRQQLLSKDTRRERGKKRSETKEAMNRISRKRRTKKEKEKEMEVGREQEEQNGLHELLEYTPNLQVRWEKKGGDGNLTEEELQQTDQPP